MLAALLICTIKDPSVYDSAYASARHVEHVFMSLQAGGSSKNACNAMIHSNGANWHHCLRSLHLPDRNTAMKLRRELPNNFILDSKVLLYVHQGGNE